MPRSDPFGARARSAPASRTSTGSPRSATGSTSTRAGHAQDPARERPPPRRRRRRRAGGRRDARVVAAGRRRPRPRSRSCPRASSSRTSPACPPSSTSRSMRDAMADLGGDPARVNPLVPADLVIDHSVQVDQFGTPGAFAFNVEREYERNGERYQLLRWAQTAFRDLRVVPPGTGIVHQVNLEFLATVVTDRARRRRPDRLPRHARRHRLAHDDDQRARRPRLRRRRHRGRGRPPRPAALPADAARRRRPAHRRAAARLDRDRPRPRRDRDAPRRTASSARSSSSPATGWPSLSLADRATISNMSPEFGATVDALPDRRRDARLPAPHRPVAPSGVALVERYAKAQGLWREPGAGPTSTSAHARPRHASSRPSPARAGRRIASR